MSTLKGKTILITGASRGIGQAIALRFAAAGANIVVLTKDAQAAIQSTADQIVAARGQALMFNVDIRDQKEIQRVVAEAVSQFGGIDVLVNNTSATYFKATPDTSAEQFDLLIGTSARAAFLLSQACLPHLQVAANPHIINISPPLQMEPNWFKDHLAFSLAKYAMSLCTLGMAAEFQGMDIAVNSLWPKTTIATQSIKDHFSPQVYAASRWPTIMADAAYELVLRQSRECSGHFFTDETLLQEAGIKDFSRYAVDPSVPLMQALFIPSESDRASLSQDLFLTNR